MLWCQAVEESEDPESSPTRSPVFRFLLKQRHQDKQHRSICGFCERTTDHLKGCHLVHFAKEQRLGLPFPLEVQWVNAIQNGWGGCQICHEALDSGELWVDAISQPGKLVMRTAASVKDPLIQDLNGKPLPTPPGKQPRPPTAAWIWHARWAEKKRKEPKPSEALQTAFNALSLYNPVCPDCPPDKEKGNKLCDNGFRCAQHCRAFQRKFPQDSACTVRDHKQETPKSDAVGVLAAEVAALSLSSSSREPKPEVKCTHDKNQKCQGKTKMCKPCCVKRGGCGFGGHKEPKKQ